MIGCIKKILIGRQGSSPAVSFAILAPLMLVTALGFSWLGHMADAQGVAEEAARAGARWLAVHPGNIAGAKTRAAEVIEGASGSYITGLSAVVTFDAGGDVLCNDPDAGDPAATAGDSTGRPRSDGYAYCRATYHYPVPLRGFWKAVSGAGTPLWTGEEPPSRPLIGEAFFVSGETGDQP
jgi:hypothetical protein